eukprot:gene10527-12296_t
MEPDLLKGVNLSKLRLLRISKMEGKVSKELSKAFCHLGENVTHLCLKEVIMESSESFIDIITSYTKLHSLELSNTNISNSVLSAVVRLSPNIVNLSLRGNSSVDDALMLCIAQHLSKVHTIDIRECFWVTDYGLLNLVDRSAQLTTLFLSVDDVHLSTVADQLVCIHSDYKLLI